MLLCLRVLQAVEPVISLPTGILGELLYPVVSTLVLKLSMEVRSASESALTVNSHVVREVKKVEIPFPIPSFDLDLNIGPFAHFFLLGLMSV